MTPVLAAIVWTPAVFYIAMGIIHTLMVLIGFRLLQVDPENNSFVGAVIAGIAINVVAFFVKDLGIIGIMVQIGTVCGALALVSGGEVLKAGVVGLACIASFGGVGQFLIPRTPLTAESIGGFTQVIIQGGLEAEPIDEEATQAISDGEIPGQATP